MENLAVASYILNIVLVIVTTVYVILTWRLAKSAKEQVQASKDQIETSREIHKANKIERLNIYKTTLLAIKSELQDHEIRTEALSKELAEIKIKVNDVGDLITNRTSIIYDADFLDKCRDRILEYEDPNFDFFQQYSFYVNKCIEFNKDLSFERIMDTKNIVKSDEKYAKALIGYITALEERIKMLKELRDKIIKNIDEEVANYLPSYLKKEMGEKYKIEAGNEK
jgi:hypothetical protein